MQLIPAIDLKDGQCVRLRQGRMDDETVFSSDPLAVAERWVAAGAQRLHLVDLDGAVAGRPANASIIGEIAQTFPDLAVQVGGGVRNEAIIQAYWDVGVDAVIIGTQAVREPQFVEQACRAFPGQIIVGLDARDGWVATDGWAEVSTVAASDLAKRFANAGVSAIIFTDIGRDGMMSGVNAEATADLARAIDIPVIASGGVTTLADVEALCSLAHTGISGAIVGRALYEGSLDLARAQRRADALTGGQ